VGYPLILKQTLALTFASALPCNAAAPESAPGPSSVPVVVVQPASVQDPRLDVLKAELQVLKDFTQNVLSTVYFALSTTVVKDLTPIELKTRYDSTNPGAILKQQLVRRSLGRSPQSSVYPPIRVTHGDD
jgi:hypothetical protein